MRVLLVALAFAALGAGIAVGVMAWEPWENGDKDEPTRAVPQATVPSGPQFTGAEAAGKADVHWLRSLSDSERRDISISCDPETFNERTSTWIVVCTLIGPANFLEVRMNVDDRTGQVSVLE